MNNLIKKILSQYNNYPSGSLSKRDIILTLPFGNEEYFSSINMAISDYTYKEFNKANLEKPEQMSVFQIRATSELQTILQNIHNDN